MLKYVHPDQLRELWPTIKPGVEAVANTHDHWIPEDLYMAIKSGSVQLYVGHDEKYRGFVAMQEQHTERGKIWHIWALYSNARDINVIKQGLDEIKAWAAAQNVVDITFSTTRKGWERHAQKLGFEPNLVTYRMKR